VTGTAGDPVPDVDKIGVLRANALGDYLFTLPALEALRAAYPAAEVVLLGAPWHRRELSGRPGPVDRVLVVPPLPGIRAAEPDEPAGPEDLLAACRRERFDLVLQLHGGGRNSNPLVRRIGARVTAGLRAGDAPPLDRWLRYVFHQPEVFRYLEVVGLVGAAPVGLTPVFGVTAADRAAAARAAGPAAAPRAATAAPRTGPAAAPRAGTAAPRAGTAAAPRAGPAVAPRVVLHPGATDPRRRWPPERFAAVGNALAAAGCEILLTGTGAERDLVERVRAGLNRPARSLVDALSLGGLAGLFADCALVVANDTGPLHLATAVGTPTVGLYWVGNVINCAPATRDRHRPIASWVIHCPRCGADCTREVYPARTGDRCWHTDSFLTDIPVEEVVDAAFDLLGRARAGAVSAGPVAGATGSAR
jgi:ADP-heptose:LPS heptosyltransferase